VQKLKRKTIDRLAASRAFYAKISAAAGGELQGDLERAFELVPRESGSGANRFGVSLLVTRLQSRFSAKAVGYCGFIDCVGRDSA